MTILALFLTLGLIFWSLQDPICLNSSIVKKIDIPSDQGRLSLLSCGYRDSDLGSLPADQQNTYKYLEADIASLEVFKNLVDETYKPNFIVKVSIEKPQVLEWQNNTIMMGIDHYENRNELRRLLIQTWLRGFLKSGFIGNRVVFESLTDIFQIMVYGKLDKSLDSKKWIDEVLSEKDLCESEWNPIERETFCEDLILSNQNLEKLQESLTEVSIWSLRPLLVKYFAHYYLGLSGSDKISFFKEFYYNVLNTDISSRAFPDRVDMTSLAQTFQGLRILLFNLNKYNLPEKKFDIDLYVLYRNKNLNLNQIGDLIEYSQSHREKSVILRKNDDFYILPEMRRLRVGYSNLETKKSVVVSCSNPTLNNILSHKVKNGRVLMIADCSEKDPLYITEYLINGVQAFSDENLKSNFLIFHVPSLKIAKDNWQLSTNSSYVVSKGPEAPSRLKSILFGWNLLGSERLQKIEAPLPIVEWIRWKGLTNHQPQ